ncbi:hypothetical protein C1280_20670 [Gemmata obscuriglobus]|uniref:Uncharacterized protein n=1 Tax=Gemmata obscuriglobus TaxID=114 RepID=A0A2Z3HD13_9BACT|nr:hypothetical protein C1280_20670 [Gemmata obscuriglobus]
MINERKRVAVDRRDLPNRFELRRETVVTRLGDPFYVNAAQVDTCANKLRTARQDPAGDESVEDNCHVCRLIFRRDDSNIKGEHRAHPQLLRILDPFGKGCREVIIVTPTRQKGDRAVVKDGPVDAV